MKKSIKRRKEIKTRKIATIKHQNTFKIHHAMIKNVSQQWIIFYE